MLNILYEEHHSLADNLHTYICVDNYNFPIFLYYCLKYGPRELDEYTIMTCILFEIIEFFF